MLLKTSLSALLSFLFLSPVYAGNCILENLPIKPLVQGKYDAFQGKTAHLDLRFSNDANTGDVDAFPEPPLQVFHTDTKTQCDINGGIWVRKDIFVSQGEQMLVTHEYSGSNDYLVFYRTADCSKVQEIDVSYAHWKIHKQALHVQPVKSNGKKKAMQNYTLDAFCKAVPAGKE